MIDRSHEYWTPEPIWCGGTAFLLAGGASLRGFQVERLRGRHVMVINSSCHAAPWAEILYFTDNSWFEKHRAIVNAWQGLVITLSRHAKRDAPDKVRRILGDRIQGETPGEFPKLGSQAVRQGKSSGHTAVGLAFALGAKRIVLLGYDMRMVDGRTHHHDDYAMADHEIYAREWIPEFDGWNEAALKHGVTIVNATPGSALKEFSAVDIEEELACAVSQR